MFLAALGRMKQVIPVSEWQGGRTGRTAQLFFGDKFLTYTQRLSMMVFLYGNGTTCDDITALIHHRLRDKSAHLHVYNTLQTLRKNIAPSNWHYYDVHRGHKCRLDGETYHDACYSKQEEVSTHEDDLNRAYRQTGSYSEAVRKSAHATRILTESRDRV